MVTFDTFDTFGTSDTSRGFTLIEMSLVMGILLTLASITFIAFLKIQEQSTLFASTSVLLSDIQSQQIKAMTGDTESSGEISDFGIYFEEDSYTLFRGSSYSPASPTNARVNLEPTLSFEEITIPASTLVFSKGSGEITNFNPSNNSLKVRSDNSGGDFDIQLNKYGVLTAGE